MLVPYTEAVTFCSEDQPIKGFIATACFQLAVTVVKLVLVCVSLDHGLGRLREGNVKPVTFLPTPYPVRLAPDSNLFTAISNMVLQASDVIKYPVANTETPQQGTRFQCSRQLEAYRRELRSRCLLHGLKIIFDAVVVHSTIILGSKLKPTW